MKSERFMAVLLGVAALLATASRARADNDPAARFRGAPTYDLAVTNVKWEAATEQHSYVAFDLSWSYSWRAAWVEDNSVTGAPLKVENWDAAWVFVKFLAEKDKKESVERNHWRHATLSTDAAHHVTPAGAANSVGLADDGSRGVGVFVYRDAVGHGNNDFRGVKLSWLHGADKVDPRKAALAVHSIAMVYVPEGPFKVGTGCKSKVARFADGPTRPLVGMIREDFATEECGSFTDGSWRGGATVPFLVDAGWSGPVAEGTNARRIGPAAGRLWGTLVWDTHNRCPQLNTIGVPGALNDDFPTGYRAFYCMKYELTQGQYAAFLNSLAPDVAATRAFISGDGQSDCPPKIDKIEVKVGAGYRPHVIKEQDGHTITCSADKMPRIPVAPDAGKNKGLEAEAEKDPAINALVAEAMTDENKPKRPPVYTARVPHRACNYLSWLDGFAYAVWAGLRPMTELEYEKACRGPLKPVPDEYAWGTAAIAGMILLDGKTLIEGKHYKGDHSGYVLQNAGKPDESVVWKGSTGPDASHGNAVWGGTTNRREAGKTPADAVSGPLRVGAFATPDSGRVAAGASYWGIMELSGNLWERVVAVGNPAGRRFAGTHGDWPEVKMGPETWGWGFGLRGGAINSWPGSDEHNRLRTSDREMMAATTPVSNSGDASRGAAVSTNFRCVRTAKIVPIPGGLPAPEPAPRPLPKPGTGREGAPAIRKTPSGDQWKVSIENVTLSPSDAKTATVTFDISWGSSWRDKNNHDATWVFFKVRADDKSDWQHVKLAADKVLNPAGYGQAEGGTPLDLIVPDGEDGFTGMFVRRAAAGEGPLAAQRVTAVWDFTANKGITKEVKVSVRAFGIQMVYVPEGQFCLGSGGLEVGGFYQYTDGSQHVQPYRVTGPGAIPTGRQAGKLWVRNHGGPLEDGGAIPASFPNGYAAFYCMKYHIIPDQYAAFLNTLAEKEGDERYAGPERCAHSPIKYSGTNGHVKKSPTGGYSGSSGGARGGPGCFGLSWADGAAFAAWAGLRPMTELELEKVVRGSREPIPDEVGPSYWGVSGFNAWDWDAFKGDPQCERPVTASNAKGRGFAGTHGRGTLTLPADWPQADAVGSGLRCIYYGSSGLDQARARVSAPGFFSTFTNSKCEDLPRARLSDRLLAAIADPERLYSHKWRGVRTAPKGVGQ
jgi:formylglycine-generating enzyme required for sulfatase activity